MRNRLMVAAVSGALIGLAPQLVAQEVASGALTDADIAAIRNVPQQWAAHAKMGHAAVVAKLYTEDAVELPPYMPAVKGRAAIQQRITEGIVGLRDMSITSAEIDGMGGIAFDRGTYSATIMQEGMEEAMTVTGKYIAVLRKQADGAWLLSRLIWNEDTPPPGMPPM